MNSSKLQKATILVIEDDAEMRETLCEVLQDQFLVLLATSVREGRNLVKNHRPDLILTDKNLGDADGIELCQDLRSNKTTQHIPVIILTGNNDEEIRIRSFQAGADDFIEKPFSPTELRSRISAKLRRLDEARELANPISATPKQLKEALVFVDIKIEEALFRVSIDKRRIELSLIEFRILQKLVQFAGQPVSREDLEEFVWGPKETQSRVLDTHMSSLRKKLEASRTQLKTLYSFGYMIEEKSA